MAVGEERTTVGAAVVETGVVVREPVVWRLHVRHVSHDMWNENDNLPLPVLLALSSISHW